MKAVPASHAEPLSYASARFLKSETPRFQDPKNKIDAPYLVQGLLRKREHIYSRCILTQFWELLCNLGAQALYNKVIRQLRFKSTPEGNAHCYCYIPCARARPSNLDSFCSNFCGYVAVRGLLSPALRIRNRRCRRCGQERSSHEGSRRVSGR